MVRRPLKAWSYAQKTLGIINSEFAVGYCYHKVSSKRKADTSVVTAFLLVARLINAVYRRNLTLHTVSARQPVVCFTVLSYCLNRFIYGSLALPVLQDVALPLYL